MSTLQQLIDQRNEIDKQIETTRKHARADAIAKIRALMAEFGITAADLGGKAAGTGASAGKGSKVAAKYRDNATGNTWSGRGLKPKWLEAALSSGKKLEDFAV